MKVLSGVVASCVVALLFQGCATQPEERAVAQEPLHKARSAQPRDKVPREFVITPAILERALQYVLIKQKLYTGDVECDPVGDVCERVKIYIVQPSDANGTYCVGLIPEVVHFPNTASGNAQKTIVWQIVPPASPVPPNSAFEFYNEKDHGIVVLSDTNPKQLKNGKLGNGNSGNTDPMFYNMKNAHRVKVDASYLPIIVQRVPPATLGDPEKVALCGTPDPRILND